MNDMKIYLDDRLKTVVVKSGLKEDILEETTKVDSKENVRGFRRSMTAAAALCLFFIMSVTVLASTVPAVNNFLYSITPELAELLQPINKIAESQGIKVEIMYAVNDSHRARVYFTIQDTEGKNRVGKDIDLCDTCHIDGPTMFGLNKISYDEETQTAFFMLDGSGEGNLTGKVTSFRISQIMSDKAYYDWYNTGIDILEHMQKETEGVSLSKYVYTGGGGGGKSLLENNLILEPDVLSIPLGEGIDFATISNIGFLNGKLHIQTKWEVGFDNHGHLWLTNKGKEVTQEDRSGSVSCGSIYFRTEEDSAQCGNNLFAKHIEYVYDVSSLEELSQYDLWANLVGDGVATKGNWKVNFRLTEAENLVITDFNGAAERVEVTSLGIYIDKYIGKPEDCEIVMTMKDGSVSESSLYKSYEIPVKEEYQWNLGYYTNNPVKLDTIESIALDGVIIYK